MECYSSVGTHLDIFQVLSKPKKSEEEKKVSSKQVQVQIDDEAEAILLQSVEPLSESASPRQSDEKLGDHFDLSEAMKVKTLYEKVAKFQECYGNNHNLLITVYRLRAALQIILCTFILLFNFYHDSSLSDILKCQLEEVFVTKYEYFVCARFIAPYYRAITLIFAFVAFVYLVTIVYAFVWSVKNTRRLDVFADVTLADDKVHIKGDLAFLFSLLEQYNKLYCDRLAVFLSEGLKDKLDKKIAKQKNKLALKKQHSQKK